jgi:hypothetical protein
MSRRLPIRRKLNPPAPPVEHFRPSDYALSPEEAWELADIECEIEAAEADA